MKVGKMKTYKEIAEKHDARYEEDSYPEDAWDADRELYIEQHTLDFA